MDNVFLLMLVLTGAVKMLDLKFPLVLCIIVTCVVGYMDYKDQNAPIVQIGK